MNKNIRLLILILILAPVIEAKEEYEDGVYVIPQTGTTEASLIIRGKIDAMTLMDVTNEIPYLTGLNMVWLDSPGGDVESAIKIGKLLRKYKAMARVIRNSECLSSCVFIYAGAVQRQSGGKIGIHRPYSATVKNMDMTKWQLWYEQVGTSAREYLKSVNVDPDLYDEMLLIPPERIKLLSDEELFKFGLVERDPVYMEWLDNRAAQKYGLTRAELIIMEDKAKTECREKHHPSDYKGNTKLADKMLNKCRESVFNRN